MKFPRNPLATMHLTQPFGENWAPDDLYKKLGMHGHNGLDYRAADGTQVFAVADGTLEYETESTDWKNPRGYGINARLWVKESETSLLEVIYGHLQRIAAPAGPVVAGSVIAYSDTTGAATGPHLHFGIRRWTLPPNNGQRFIRDYWNGYFGWVDPQPYLPETREFPVDIRYGQPKSLVREMAFSPSKLWAERKLKRRLTEREYNALVYGFWDLGIVLDPAMFVVWRDITKPEYARLLKKKPEEIAIGNRGY